MDEIHKVYTPGIGMDEIHNVYLPDIGMDENPHSLPT
jgi:hypothetical protein